MPHDFATHVAANRDLGNGNYRLEFAVPRDVAPEAATMQPAQFFMIGIPGARTLLRRPYSVCGLPGTFADAVPGTHSVLYKVVGQGTALLAALAPGAEIRVLGPLGHGFRLPDDPEEGAVFVAGGIGSAPFPALFAAWDAPAADGAARRRPDMIYGARTAGDLPLHDWFVERSGRFATTTDDGSRGERGRVTGPLADWLAGPEAPRRIYACGPDPMLHALSRLALEHDVPCALAMEAHMACGFGVCLGCVVPVHDGAGGVRYDRLCVDGPVLPAEAVAW